MPKSSLVRTNGIRTGRIITPIMALISAVPPYFLPELYTWTILITRWSLPSEKLRTLRIYNASSLPKFSLRYIFSSKFFFELLFETAWVGDIDESQQR